MAAPARLASPAPAGTITPRPGPFDDRFTLSAPALTDGVVTSFLTVTSDVSEILVLAVTADFYDAGGALLGRVRYDHAPEHAHGEGVPDEAVPLRLEADPGYRAAVSSAVVAVPVLVLVLVLE